MSPKNVKRGKPSPKRLPIPTSWSSRPPDHPVSMGSSSIATSSTTIAAAENRISDTSSTSESDPVTVTMHEDGNGSKDQIDLDIQELIVPGSQEATDNPEAATANHSRDNQVHYVKNQTFCDKYRWFFKNYYNYIGHLSEDLEKFHAVCRTCKTEDGMSVSRFDNHNFKGNASRHFKVILLLNRAFYPNTN